MRKRLPTVVHQINRLNDLRCMQDRIFLAYESRALNSTLDRRGIVQEYVLEDATTLKIACTQANSDHQDLERLHVGRF